MCAHSLFCTKFNSQQLLFEQFFDIISNFNNVQQENEFTFPFQHNIIFETYQSSKAPSSAPLGDRHVLRNVMHKYFYFKRYLI